MKITILRKLWNYDVNADVEVADNYGQWAIQKGYAIKAEKTEYQNKVEKTTINNKAENVPAQNKQRGSRGRSSK